jgi:rRNA-processing protein FCF1
MKIVLDTNILLVSIPRMSKYRAIFDALLQNKFTLEIEEFIELLK